jgi:hypothetical protein
MYVKSSINRTLCSIQQHCSTSYFFKVHILLIRVKHLHDQIISLRDQIWAHRTSLTPPLFIEVPVPSQESER